MLKYRLTHPNNYWDIIDIETKKTVYSEENRAIAERICKELNNNDYTVKDLYENNNYPKRTHRKEADMNTTDNILDTLTLEQKEKIYKQVQYEHVRADIRCRAEDVELNLTEDEISEAARMYVYECRYDCNASYWENLDTCMEYAHNDYTTDVYNKVKALYPAFILWSDGAIRDVLKRNQVTICSENEAAFSDYMANYSETIEDFIITNLSDMDLLK